MTIINVMVDDQRLEFSSMPVVASEGVKETYVKFALSSDWSGFGATALFYRDDSPEDVYTSVLDGAGLAEVPYEITAAPGWIRFGLSGSDGTSVHTSEILKYKIVKGKYTSGQSSEPPAPGIYEQMLAIAGQMRDTLNASVIEQNAIIRGLVSDMDDLRSDMETEQTTFESVVTGQINTLVNNFAGSSRETILFEGSHAVNIGDEIDLVSDPTVYDYLDIVLNDGLIGTIIGPTQNSQWRVTGETVKSTGASVTTYVIEGVLDAQSLCLRVSTACAIVDTGTASTRYDLGSGPIADESLRRYCLKVIGRKLTDDAEVLNIRVGADGVTYQTAGTAVRSQLDKKLNAPISGGAVDYGTSGQLLATDGQGNTEWVDSVIPDGSITVAKLAPGVIDTTYQIQGAAASSVTVGQSLASKANAADVTSLGTRVTGVESDIGELKNALDELAVPLTLVTTYEGKQARATGLVDSAANTVYQFQIPDNCETVHIVSYFYGNSRIIFTNSATPIDFSTGQYQQYPSTGYNNPTDIDDDYATLRFKYVYVTFLVTDGKECKASCSAWDIINFIGSNTPIAENTNGNVTNFNDAKRNHIYVISSGISNIQNYPPISNGGTLLCYASYNIDNVQLFVSNQMAIYIRRKWGSTWSDWKQIPTADAVQTLVNTAVNTAFSGYYPFNILQAFKNIVCIGDSLTYSQVYTGNSTSRQAYKPYPKVLADKAGAIETILATAGDTAQQAWNRNSENIVQKEACLTVVYLGTNGGLTDTMDTDMVGDDYTQWADTNTGAYGKIVAKSIAVGSRVVLVKVHSSSGGVPITNSVIEKMATRFNVPVINNTYLSGVKYHSWPNGGGTNGTHYNDLGYAVFADQVANSISQLSAEDAVKIIPN